MNKGKRLKKNLKKKVWLDRESKLYLCDDRMQRSIHWGNIWFIRKSQKKKKWFIRILHHLYQIALRPVNAKIRVRFPVTPEFLSVSFSTALRLFISPQKTCSLRSCSLSWISICSIFTFVSSQSIISNHIYVVSYLYVRLFSSLFDSSVSMLNLGSNFVLTPFFVSSINSATV